MQDLPTVNPPVGPIEFISVPCSDDGGTTEIPVVPIYAAGAHHNAVLCAALLHAVRRIDALEAKLAELTGGQ